MIVLSLDRDVAGHLAVALRRHRDALRTAAAAEPDGLAELEQLALDIVQVAQHASPSVTVPDLPEDGLHARAYLSRRDVQRLTGFSLATIDRWLSSGRLKSTGTGRLRRIARSDLEAFVRSA